jgi:hypothetical protein
LQRLVEADLGNAGDRRWIDARRPEFGEIGPARGPVRRMPTGRPSKTPVPSEVARAAATMPTRTSPPWKRTSCDGSSIMRSKSWRRLA